MKCFLKAAALLTVIWAAFDSSAQGLDVVNPAYIYSQEQSGVANYMYIGFAPRMQDPQRIRVIISKGGLTMRVFIQLTPDEVIDYPHYLVRRYDQVNGIVRDRELRILQTQRYDAYAATIESIRHQLQAVRGDIQSRYEYGVTLLKHFFPANIFEIVENGNVVRVEGHFVYPITIHAQQRYPEAKEYRAYDLNERRSHFKPLNNEIFGGFPAIWIDPKGKGTGVHGPIRYSTAAEGMKPYWADHNFLNEAIDPMAEINARIRWDLVRTNDSHGCFRAESMELRHLLPSDPNKIMDDNKRKLNLDTGPGIATTEVDYDSVVWDVRNEYDVLTVPGYFSGKIVNVDYYVTDPYAPADKSAWIKARLGGLLTEAERANKKTRGEVLMSKFETEVQTFPYLNPETLEFKVKNGGASNSTMTLLNQAH